MSKLIAAISETAFALLVSASAFQASAEPAPAPGKGYDLWYDAMKPLLDEMTK